MFQLTPLHKTAFIRFFFYPIFIKIILQSRNYFHPPILEIFTFNPKNLLPIMVNLKTLLALINQCNSGINSNVDIQLHKIKKAAIKRASPTEKLNSSIN
jgi:hypothetical protein